MYNGGTNILNFSTNSTLALSIAASGAATFSSSVGVGGTSAGNFSGVTFTGPFLDVAGILQIKGTSANTIAGLQFGGDTYRKAVIYSSIGTDAPYLAFSVASSGSSSSASESMRITSGGNVLIGTTSDDGTKLRVNGAIKTAGFGSTTARAWKLGELVTATVIGVNTTGYITIEVNGSQYNLALANLA
jgi:hypothetical protein